MITMFQRYKGWVYKRLQKYYLNLLALVKYIRPYI
jgi:hypothetical protein